MLFPDDCVLVRIALHLSVVCYNFEFNSQQMFAFRCAIDEFAVKTVEFTQRYIHVCKPAWLYAYSKFGNETFKHVHGTLYIYDYLASTVLFILYWMGKRVSKTNENASFLTNSQNNTNANTYAYTHTHKNDT